MRPVVLTLLFLAATALLSSETAAQTASLGAIRTEGAVWDRSTINVVITPAQNAPWFKQSYSSDVRHAVERWTQSIIVYTDSYGSNYLRRLTFEVYTAGVNQSIPSAQDVQISFLQSFPESGPPALGVTSSRVSPSNVFEPPVTMKLAAFDPSGLRQLTDTDMVNIATHEFGHAIGLDHASQSTTDDRTLELMAAEYLLPVGSFANQLEAPSTLDLYALSQIYSWLATSATLTGPGPAATTVSLPATIPYTSAYPYPEQITGLRSIISQDNLKILVLALTTIIVLGIAITVGILFLRRKQAPQPTPPVLEPAAVV